MKLTDIKKLKVSELRSRLGELGLDVGGLKAELVGRLWSALEAQHSGGDDTAALEAQRSGGDDTAALEAQHSGGDDTGFVKLPNDPSLIPSETADDRSRSRSSSPPAEAGDVTAQCDLVRSREFTDSATQTETDTGLPKPPEVSRFMSAGAPGYRAEVGEVEMHAGTADDPGEDKGAPPSEMGRGRAFYEFKEEIRYKRTKSPQPPFDRGSTEEEDDDKIRLNPHDSHLHFEVGPDGARGQPRFWARFPLLWSGCRLTHGALQGRVGFEVRLERKLSTTQLEGGEETCAHGVRVGWSMVNTSLLLGEDEFSFAYDGRGKKVSGGKEEEFGEPFSVGDIIGCYASISADAAVDLSFHKNGRPMGVAFSLGASGGPLDRVLFPHVLCKSCSVGFHLDPTAPPWYPSPEGFAPLAALSAGRRVRATPAPASRAQCEVLVMVGLPGSGKSHWARTRMKQHPEKRYRLLGTEELLACMISGGQRDSALQQASQCLTDLIKMAAQIPGNYILDQCNILFSARRHKLQLFAGFRRQVVVFFPPADEWERRLSQHRTSDGETIPETALLKLQVSCSLPEQESDPMEELQYVELPQEQARTLLQKYKDEARRLLPPMPRPEEKKKRRLNKHRSRPRCPLPSHGMHWPGLNCQGWNNVRLDMQSWRQQQPRNWNVSYQDYHRDFGNSGSEGYW